MIRWKPLQDEEALLLVLLVLEQKDKGHPLMLSKLHIASSTAEQWIEPAKEPGLQALQEDLYAAQRPDARYALKKKSGKRVTFTLQQKEIMIDFYNRQAENGVRASALNVIQVMKNQGIEPLKESQIKS